MRSNRQSQMRFLVLIALGIIVAAHHGAQADEEISFNRDVLPILAKIEDVARQTQESHKAARAKA